MTAVISLRPYQISDADTIISWIGDEVSFRKWCADRYDKYPITAEDMNNNYKACSEQGGFFPFTAYEESGVVGHLIMRFTDENRSVLRFGFVIVDNKKRGSGYGKQMLESAIQYAHENFNAEKITLGVFENNEAAYRCYKSVGFREIKLENPIIYHIFGEEWKSIEMGR